MKSRMRRLIASFLVLLAFQGTMLACFGKFPLVRTVYEFNAWIGDKVGGGYLGRFVSTVVMWVFLLLPVYEIAGFIDIVLFNLIEFWSGKPLFMKGSEGMAGLDSTLVLTADPNVVKLDVKGRESLFFLRDKPMQAFVKRGENYVPVTGRISETGMADIVAGNQILVHRQLDAKEVASITGQMDHALFVAMKQQAAEKQAIAQAPAVSNPRLIPQF